MLMRNFETQLYTSNVVRIFATPIAPPDIAWLSSAGDHLRRTCGSGGQNPIGLPPNVSERP